jgi:hypothetical protein
VSTHHRRAAVAQIARASLSCPHKIYPQNASNLGHAVNFIEPNKFGCRTPRTRDGEASWLVQRHANWPLEYRSTRWAEAKELELIPARHSDWTSIPEGSDGACGNRHRAFAL